MGKIIPYRTAYFIYLLLFLFSVSASGATLSQPRHNNHKWISILILAGSTLILASITLTVICYYKRRRLKKGIPYSSQRDSETTAQL